MQSDAEAPIAWMPRDQWDARVRGADCFFCAELAADAEQNEYFSKIADLRLSQLRLASNQNVLGYCVLVCTRHVCEPFQLPPAECAAFFDDVMVAARAIAQAFHPDKLNYEILGNLVPHLHCHLNPRYYGDPWPGSPVRPTVKPVHLSLEEYSERVALIRSFLP